MDFYRIKERSTKNGIIEIYPDFLVKRSDDLMIRGKSFYAIWDEEAGLWSTDEFDVQRLIDQDLLRYAEEVRKKNEGVVQVKLLGDFSSNSWLQFRNYVGHLSDSSRQLDEKLTFSNTEVKKRDYVSRRLPYPLQEGSIAAYDELMSVLYEPEERAKLEWAVGAIIAGDAKHIQKFIVLYGPAGAGKSTFLNIVQALFIGYLVTFEAKSLTGHSNAFSTEVFRSNPLVALQHDGDLSKIEDNTKLNSIVSHEDMTMNEKYKPSYTARIIAFLFMGTNKPVKITDAKSGIIRRLIDVQPSGMKLPAKRYHILMSQVEFELGAIAHHCLGVYRSMGMDYYSGYKAVEMMLQTDVFFNFIEDSFDVFKENDGVSLTQAYKMYKRFCEETLVEYTLPMFKFREELRNYFHNFDDRITDEMGNRVRSWYSGFITDHFKVQKKEEPPVALTLDSTISAVDADLAHQPAQYASKNETPIKKWAEVTTTLEELDTTQLHYVKPPLNHIVIDFDLKGDDGEKSLELNLEAASKWPATYAEYSKSGSGIHLHYYYDGDVNDLSRVYTEGIEIKVFNGDSSLRRRLSRCNDIPVATINSGLPLKEKKSVISNDTIKSEKALRDLIHRNLRKEIHNATKPSVDFISKILEDAYSSGMQYDVTDLKPKILAFANNSTNQALAGIKIVMAMKFASDKQAEVVAPTSEINPDDLREVFFDCEVFPNLFVLNWKYRDDRHFYGKPKVVRMINPKPSEVEALFSMKLIGYNCRRYDNHILYAASMGFTNEQLYKLSKRIIDNVPHSLFGEAYNISYTDIYDYASAANKMSLKKLQIKMGIHHLELGLDWDQPVPESLWDKVAEYCDNDVISTEAAHKYLEHDFTARLILADLSGLTPNDTTNQHSTKIMFGKNRTPQSEFEYTDLSIEFPGYKFDMGKSTYRGEETGEGGYVYAEPGMYHDVAILDIASMHPSSIEALNLFGPYTARFSEIKKARVLIKRGDFETASKMLEGKLAPYLKSTGDEEVDAKNAKGLSDALKTVINSIYGLTSAKFDNPFRDPRNKDNVVAKRGALFMIDLKHFVQDRGFSAIHIKTDSIKIPGATKELIEAIMDFGMEYGYEFEHEGTYDRICLVNDAVFIAKTKDGKKPAYWTATGLQFQTPYVFKTLFSKEPIEFSDYGQTKSVSRAALYLDFQESRDEAIVEEMDDTPMALADDIPKVDDVDNNPLRFVGAVGEFIPVTEGGGTLLRVKDGKATSAPGAKGYQWLESEMVQNLGLQDKIDKSYYTKLVDAAIEKISQYGDFEAFAA